MIPMECWEKLSAKLYFTVSDIAEVLDISRPSAWTWCSRNVKEGFIIRLKNDFYVLAQRWGSYQTLDFMKIANYLQVPSYISGMSALSYFNISTQVQQSFFESASVKRTRQFGVKGCIFRYFKLKQELYFGFVKKDGLFIATPEKAFADVLYMYSFGKSKFDFSAIDFSKFNRVELTKILKKFPDKTRRIGERYVGSDRTGKV